MEIGIVMIRNKKAQAYPIYVIVVTIAALTFAYIAVQRSQEMNDFIGNKQSQLFATLQQAEASNIFVEKSAELAALVAIKDMQKSCMIEYDLEQSSDPLISACGKFVYPLWSTETDICLPRCRDSFIDSFNNELSGRLDSFSRITGVSVPKYYSLDLEVFDEYFLIHGISSHRSDFNIIPRNIVDVPISKETNHLASEGLVTVPEPGAAPVSSTTQQPAPKPTIIWPSTTPNIPVNTNYFGSVSARERTVLPSKIVLHHTAGANARGAIITWQQMANGVGAHYVIDKDGTIYYVVDEKLNVGHAGCRKDSSTCTAGQRCAVCQVSPPPATNDNSIGIEIVNEGYAKNLYTNAQYESIRKLLDDIYSRLSIPINNDNVLAHYQITDDKWDPSPNFDWSRIGLPGHITYGDQEGGCSGISSFGYSKSCSAKGGTTGSVVATSSSNSDASGPEIDLGEMPGVDGTYGLLSWPSDNSDKTIVSCFGRRITSGSANHPAIDIRANKGDAVLAAAPGTVIYTDPSCWGRVIIEHVGGLKTEYLHMSEIYVSDGTEVERGEMIGVAGGSGKKNGNCSLTAYPVHIHFAVMYDNAKKDLTYNKKFVIKGKSGETMLTKEYDSQELSISIRGEHYVNPLCFLEKQGYNIKKENNDECFTPINSEFESSCKLYGFPDFLASLVQDYIKDPPLGFNDEDMSGDVVSEITGLGTKTPEISSETRVPSLRITSGSLGTYSFNPAFSVRVNKKLEEPVKEVTDWYAKTWEACQEDFSGCLKTEMDKFNSVESRSFDLSFADRCEENPIFFNIMEFMEDCFSNEAYGCSCEFDASGLRSRKDMRISFSLANGNSKAELFIKDELDAKESHSFYFGELKSAVASHVRFDYLLDFNEKTGELVSAKLVPYSKSGDEFVSQEGSAFSDYKTLRLAKPTETGSGMFTNDPNILDCVYTKDKFRLCAKSRKTSLPTIKFSAWMKEKPPEELKDGSLSVTPRDPCMDSTTDKLLKLKGLDLSTITSIIPIPGVNMLSILDLMDNLEATKPTSLQVVVNNPDPDVAGYQVYCNDMLLDSLPLDFLKSHNPNNFVAIANNQIQSQVSQLDNFVQTNPYSDFLAGYECDVPVTGIGGKTVKIPAIKGLEKDGKTIFDIGSCGNLPVALDKMLPKNYCVTLIPVDKNGRKLEGKSLTNCAKTNSLLTLAIKDLLDKELGSFLSIAQSFLPEELSPGVKSPCPGKIESAVTGGGFDLAELANFKDVDSIKSYLDSFATKEINKELASISFLNTMDSMDNQWSKQLVMSSLSKELKDEDARMLFNNMLSGNTRAGVQSFVMEKGLDYVEDEKANEILRESLGSGDVSDVAMEEISTMLDESLSSEEKKKDMMFIINNRDAGELTNRVLNKAQQTSCGQKLKDDDIEKAMACLNSADIETIYSESLDSYESSQEGLELAQRGLDKLPASDKKNAISSLMNGDAYGFASQAIQSELEKLPDSQKTAFVKDALNGKMPGVEEIQSELTRMIPAMNNEYVTALLRNQDVKGLLKDKLKAELDSQLKSFFGSACTPKAKP